VEKLANGVNHPNFGLLADMGNFLCADEDPAKAFGSGDAAHGACSCEGLPRQTGYVVESGGGLVPQPRGQLPARIDHRARRCSDCTVPGHHEAGRIRRRAVDRVRGLEDPIKGIAIGLENLRRFVKETV